MNISVRGQWWAGLVLGVYAFAITFAPGLGTKALLCAPLLAIPLVWWLLSNASHWVTGFFLAAWLLPPLPVALGNSGPHVALFFAAVGVWMGLAYLARWRFTLDGAALPIVLLFGSLCLSLPLALLYSGPTIAALSAARVLLFAISVYVYFFVRSGPGTVKLPPDSAKEYIRTRFGRIGSDKLP